MLARCSTFTVYGLSPVRRKICVLMFGRSVGSFAIAAAKSAPENFVALVKSVAGGAAPPPRPPRPRAGSCFHSLSLLRDTSDCPDVVAPARPLHRDRTRPCRVLRAWAPVFAPAPPRWPRARGG